MVRKLKLTKKEDNKQQTIWETNAYYRKRYLKGGLYLLIQNLVDWECSNNLKWIYSMRKPINIANHAIQMNNDFTLDNNTRFESGYVIPKWCSIFSQYYIAKDQGDGWLYSNNPFLLRPFLRFCAYCNPHHIASI